MTKKIKAIIFTLIAVIGLVIFSVFVTCCYAGPFKEGFQVVTGMFLLFLNGLIFTVTGIIGTFAILDEEDGENE